MSEFHRIDDAAATYDELITEYADDTDPWVENLVEDARAARRR